ncbi:ImuA family protein [Zavarzinia sp. CC-PAN008]|uniref:ImuA family protein n=1 Tax=Zavarzinia sp. CC-PAN008 TaxID=3243332 RepID=UPI003F745B83
MDPMRETPTTPDRAALIARLRQAVGGVDAGGAAMRVASLGDAALDRALPGGGLMRGVVHEVAPAGTGEETAALGFGAALVARLAAGRTAGSPLRPVLWLVPIARAALFGPGLAAFGLICADGVAGEGGLVVAQARRRPDLLWAMEEGLRTRGLAAVVAELDRLDLVQGRRLALAAEAGGVTAVLLRRAPVPVGEGSIAWTRWAIGAAPSAPQPLNRQGLGAPRWRASLVRARGMRPVDWLVEWDHAALRFHLAAPLADRSAEDPGDDAGPLRRRA